MTLTPEQVGIVLDWLKRASPVCLGVVLVGGAAGYVYAGKTFATVESVQELQETIQQGFEDLSARMDLSDADNLVRDIQAQVRAKEREVADLEMVLAEMDNPNSDSATVLRNRAFGARQDLAELNARLQAAQQAQSRALNSYRHLQ